MRLAAQCESESLRNPDTPCQCALVLRLQRRTGEFAAEGSARAAHGRPERAVTASPTDVGIEAICLLKLKAWLLNDTDATGVTQQGRDSGNLVPVSFACFPWCNLSFQVREYQDDFEDE